MDTKLSMPFNENGVMISINPVNLNVYINPIDTLENHRHKRIIGIFKDDRSPMFLNYEFGCGKSHCNCGRVWVSEDYGGERVQESELIG